jgi:hypothetical protein
MAANAPAGRAGGGRQFFPERLLLRLKPSRVFWHTVEILSLRCAELGDLHGFAVRLVSGLLPGINPSRRCSHTVRFTEPTAY